GRGFLVSNTHISQVFHVPLPAQMEQCDAGRQRVEKRRNSVRSMCTKHESDVTFTSCSRGAQDDVFTGINAKSVSLIKIKTLVNDNQPLSPGKLLTHKLA